MDTFPLPLILELVVSGELDRQACRRFDATCQTAERIAISKEMLWRSARLLARNAVISQPNVEESDVELNSSENSDAHVGDRRDQAASRPLCA